MATPSVYRSRHVSPLMRVMTSDLLYPHLMRDGQADTKGGSPSLSFGEVIREARKQKRMSQQELADAAGVSEPTIQRWENGRTGTPDPENARRAFLALSLDPRLIPVILGYVTADEMGLPPEAPRVFAPTVERAIAILEDPTIPSAAKAEWVEFLQFRAQSVSANGKDERAAG
jgi:transcriptional regulator with XRE-family HTH domain